MNRCLAEKLVPKGLRLEFEPTIGNYDQEFVDTWYAKLKSFSLTLMKDIASYRDKTIAKTKQNIRETETDLKSATAKEEYFQIQETIKTNEAKTKRIKYKPQTTREEAVQSTKEPTAFKKSYANKVQQPQHPCNTSNTNVAN